MRRQTGAQVSGRVQRAAQSLRELTSWGVAGFRNRGIGEIAGLQIL
jgi:hypothetical protein